MPTIKELLEKQQITLYFMTIVVAIILASCIQGTSVLVIVINPVLAFMLFVTFLQVPITEFKRFLLYGRFIAALLITNFVIIPLFVGILALFLPHDPLIKLGVLFVLLAPCIDYVVTFSHLGKADTKSLMMSTPILLVMQMLLLPIYLGLFIGNEIKSLIQLAPFVHTFIELILVPFILAAIVQYYAKRNQIGSTVAQYLNLMPVPATALTLFVVIIAIVPQLENAAATALIVIPYYVIFAIIAPLLGWRIAKLFHLPNCASRSIAFSAGTRNALVILPLALAIPNAIPLLPAVIVTQTLIELVSELFYIHFIAKLGD